MQLNNLANNLGAKKDKKRLGRGIGSGKGKTCGRGHKGQKARSGVAIKGFEGGQMPMKKRLPKRGFNAVNPSNYQIINLDSISILLDIGVLDASKVITKQNLIDFKLINNLTKPVKILCGFQKSLPCLSLQVDAYSKAARAIIEASGGKIL